jgi:hypothetical protein
LEIGPFRLLNGADNDEENETEDRRGAEGEDRPGSGATAADSISCGCKNRTQYSALIIAIVTPQEAKMIAACGAMIQAWRGTISRSDAMLVALGAIQHARDPLRDRLAIETAVALCGWDLVGVAEEAARAARSGADLFAVPPGKPSGDDQGRWEHALSELFEGVPFVKHEVCEPQELYRRIWRAQVAVLFDWLEEIRLTFISRIAPALRVNEADPTTWEWSQLAYHLKRQTIPYQ